MVFKINMFDSFSFIYFFLFGILLSVRHAPNQILLYLTPYHTIPDKDILQKRRKEIESYISLPNSALGRVGRSRSASSNSFLLLLVWSGIFQFLFCVAMCFWNS